MDTPRSTKIGKYRLDRKIGAGGMGEVYLAHDTQLERAVAIKLIRRERLDDIDVRHLFEKEAKATARLQHPAIVRIYDFLRWEDHDCLVMEFLEGQSFKSFFAEADNKTPERALPIFLDIAEGLVHAHHQGIIHRDLKPGNLWITPEGQVKILDFGVAKLVEQDTTVSKDQFIGTPDYMSPQQAGGESLDPRSDLFSIGIIFYEALTEVHPFKGENWLETMANIRGNRQRPACEVDESIPREISNLIDRLLAKNPAKRPASADEVAEILSTTVGRPRPPRAHALRQHWARVLKGLTVAAVTAVLAAAAYLVPQGSPGRPSVAVLGDARASDAWVSTATVEILNAHLGSDESLRVLPSRHSAFVPAPEAVTSESLRELREALRVDHFVLCNTIRSDETWQVKMRLIDARRGSVHAEQTIVTSAAEEELEGLLEDAAAVLRQALGHRGLAREPLRAARASFPDGAAGRFYSEGLDDYRRYELRSAQTAFERAIDEAPKAPMPHLYHAIVLAALGDLEAADKAGTQAEQQAALLTQEQGHEISARTAALARDWQTAVDHYRANFERFPDVLRHGRGLAEALLNLGQADEALDIVNGLRELSLARLDDGDLDLVSSYADLRLGRLVPARAAASQAAKIGESMDDARLEAEGQLVLSMTLNLLGDQDAARRAQEAARLAAARSGHRLILLKAFNRGIKSLIQRGEIVEALDQFQRLRELFQEAGDREHEAVMAYDLAVLLMAKNPEAATSLLAEAQAIFEEYGRREEAAVAAFTLGTISQLFGRLAEARSHYQTALETFEDLDHQIYQAVVLTSLGELAFFGADFVRALDLHHQALTINQAVPYSAGVAYDTFRLAEVLRYRGELDKAGQYYQESLDARIELGDAREIVESRIGLARFELVRKNYGNALTQAQEAAGAALDIGETDLYLQAQITEAWVHLTMEDFEIARAMLDEIELHAQKSHDRRVEYETRLLAARLHEDREESSRMLERLSADAADGGDFLYAAEAAAARTRIHSLP